MEDNVGQELLSNFSTKTGSAVTYAQAEQSDRVPSEGPGVKKAAQVLWNGSWTSLWVLEILAALFSLGCLVAAIAFLANIQGKPYAPWQVLNAQITPNSILSILSTFSKSGLLLAVAESLGQLKWAYFEQRTRSVFELQLFDEATRGPLGAIRLICSVKAKSIIVTVGAALVVLSMAIDPFTQQILSYPTKSLGLSNSTAQIGSAYHFSDRWNAPWGRKLFQNTITMSNAILLGLTNSTNPTPFYCPTGDCVWPRFTTLGICNTCENVSSQVHVKCHMPHPLAINKKQCEYTLPAAAWDRASHTFTTNVTWQRFFDNDAGKFETDPTVQMNTSVFTTFSESESQNIALVESLELHGFDSDGYGWNSTQDPIALPKAWQCLLAWCQQNYTATKCKAGSLEDTPTSSRGLQYIGKSSSSFLRAYSLANEPPPPFPNYDRDWRTIKNVYWIDDISSNGVSGSIKQIFGNDLQDIGSAGQDITGFDEQLWTGDLDEILDRVALSMSNAVRGIRPFRAINGTTIATVTMVHVNWYWLIYSATLTFGGIILLVVSMIISARGDVVVWKSSILPLLFRGLGGYNWDERSKYSLHDFELRAKLVRARLKQSGQAPGLQHCD